MSRCAAVGETRVLTEDEGICKQGMRESKKEDKGFAGWERRSFSARRRDEDRMEGLVVKMAFSRVSTSSFR